MQLKITKNLFYNRNEKNKEKKNLQYCAILNKFSLIFLLLSFVSTTQQIQKNISTNIQQSLLTTNWNKKQIIPLNNFKKQNNQNQFWWLTTKEGRKEKIKIISNNSFRERKENSKNINNIFNKKLSKNNIRRSEQKIKSENENYLNLKSLALNELDIKSDEVLYKMMKRTTLTTKEYSSIEEIPTTQIPSLKPINLNGLSPPPPPLSPQLPSLLLTFPGLPIPQQIPTSLPLSQNKQPEQYEQLGCGWDFLSQSCKDLFRVGWCQNCFDFGNQLMHDCRCVKVTNFYIQTTSFLGSSAASERANSAISSSLLSNRNIIINISTSPKPPSFGLPIPLPEFQQISPSSPSTDSKYPNNILPPPQQFHPSPQFPPPALFQSNNNSPQQIFFPLNSEFVTNIIPIGLPNFAENSQKELFINQRH